MIAGMICYELAFVLLSD